MKIILAAVAALAGCATAIPPANVPALPRETAVRWADEIRDVARDGDWILARAEAGAQLTSATLYDAGHDTVIGTGGEMTLDELLVRNHDALVVRPHRMSADDQRGALVRARAMGPDVDGPVLVYVASQTEARNGAHESFVTPETLVKYGEVIYWR